MELTGLNLTTIKRKKDGGKGDIIGNYELTIDKHESHLFYGARLMAVDIGSRRGVEHVSAGRPMGPVKHSTLNWLFLSTCLMPQSNPYQEIIYIDENGFYEIIIYEDESADVI